MKFIKLSLVAALAVSAAVAGGDIAPVEAPAPVKETSKTTISGKLTGYYITGDDSATYDMFDTDYSQLGLAATLDVTHHFTDNIAANFSAVGYTNTKNEPNYFYFEGDQSGAFINVANLTATFADTTFILGRQLLNTPMLSGFDWLLAPGSFEAYTIANSSIENVTLIGSYVRTWRINNTGDTWINLTDIDDGNNWTVSAAYDNKTISGSIWYYNVDAGAAVRPDKYTQIYVDGGYDFGVAKLEAQYANTNYDTAVDSDAYGAKISGSLSSVNLMAAYVRIDDNVAGFIGMMDGLYTSSWNTATGNSVGDNFKVEAATTFGELSASASYAYYAYDNLVEDGQEIDVILGYDFKNTDIAIIKDMDLNVVYTNTNYGEGSGDVNALEVYANYKF